MFERERHGRRTPLPDYRTGKTGPEHKRLNDAWSIAPHLQTFAKGYSLTGSKVQGRHSRGRFRKIKPEQWTKLTISPKAKPLNRQIGPLFVSALSNNQNRVVQSKASFVTSHQLHGGDEVVKVRIAGVLSRRRDRYR
jgi:hypothetical protein